MDRGYHCLRVHDEFFLPIQRVSQLESSPTPGPSRAWPPVTVTELNAGHDGVGM